MKVLADIQRLFYYYIEMNIITLKKLKNIAEIIIAKGVAKEKNIEIAWMPEYLKFGNLLRVR